MLRWILKGATSYDLHLDMVHVLCNQAESRKVICKEGIVSIYIMHWEIYLHIADTQKKRKVCSGLASKWQQSPSEK